MCAHIRRSLFLLLILGLSCPLISQGAPDREAVRKIQQFLNYNLEKPALPEDGEWNGKTVQVLLDLLGTFQHDPLWGNPPYNSTHHDGSEIYSDALAAYLRHALNEHSTNSPNADLDGRFKDFLDAMDELKAEGIFAQTKQSKNTTAVSKKQPAGSDTTLESEDFDKLFRGSLFALANGVLWGFADELWCMVADKDNVSPCYAAATEDLRYIYENHSLWTNILNTAGACFSPLGWLVIELSGFYRSSGCMIFVFAVITEIIEGIIWAIGDFINFHTIDFKMFVVMIGLSALFTGIMALRKANKKHPPGS